MTAEHPQVDAAHAVEHQAEWLSFTLDTMLCAIDILKVKEIRTFEKMTRIPFAQSFVCGLINLRGAIVPVIDLRRRFQLPPMTPDKETVVLIVTFEKDEEEKEMGIVVDGIRDVVVVDEQQVLSSSSFNLPIGDRFVLGIAESQQAMLVLVDINAVLNIDEF